METMLENGSLVNLLAKSQMGLEELITLKQKGFDMFYELTNYENAGE